MASKLLYQSSVVGNGKDLLASSEDVDIGATFPEAVIAAPVVSTP